MNQHKNIPLAKIPQSPEMKDFDAIFQALHPLVSDILIQPDKPIMVRYNGRICQATANEITPSAMKALMSQMLMSAQAGKIHAGEPQSWVHKISLPNVDEHKKLRFRCQAKSSQILREDEAVSLTMRSISSSIRRLHELNLPEPLMKGLFPVNGLILFTGPTGSGKTTTLSAVIAEQLYHPRGKVVLTFEDPVENNLHILRDITGFLSHCELGRNVKTLPLGMRSALRENPDVIMTGEMRDVETIQLGIEASNTGHVVYSTIHCNSATNVLVRIAQKLAEELSPAAVDASISNVIQSARVFVYQRLYEAMNEKRVAIIEYVVLTAEDRVALRLAYKDGGLIGATSALEEIMSKSGVSFDKAAQQSYERGELGEEMYLEIMEEFRSNVIVERGYK